MNHFRAFTNSLASAAKDITKDIQNSFDDRTKTIGRQYKINGRIVEEERLLSEGGFGFVYLVRDTSTNETMAVKKILCQDRERYELACREVEIFEKLPVHPNLVKYYGHITERDSKSREVIILLEFCPGGHVYDLMQKHSGHVPSSTIVKVLRDITAGLLALHSMNPPVQHRDLKLENVLLSSSGKYVLLDFGSWSSEAPDLSKLSREDLMKFGETVERYTTLMYRPPEMADLYKGFKISGQVDMWMLGCILFTLINNKHPFQNASNLAIVNCRYSFSQDDCRRYPPKLTELCAWLLAQNPADRPTAARLTEILDSWDKTIDEALTLPQSVIDRIEKDTRLYGIPSMTRKATSPSHAQSKSTPAQTAPPVWSEPVQAGANQPSGWEASFGSESLIDVSPPVRPQASKTHDSAATLPDLLG